MRKQRLRICKNSCRRQRGEPYLSLALRTPRLVRTARHAHCWLDSWLRGRVPSLFAAGQRLVSPQWRALLAPRASELPRRDFLRAAASFAPPWELREFFVAIRCAYYFLLFSNFPLGGLFVAQSGCAALAASHSGTTCDFFRKRFR